MEGKVSRDKVLTFSEVQAKQVLKGGTESTVRIRFRLCPPSDEQNDPKAGPRTKAAGEAKQQRAARAKSVNPKSRATENFKVKKSFN